MTTRLTWEEIVNETVEYYKTHPRSLDQGGEYCLYKGPNGACCAFSRCCVAGIDFSDYEKGPASNVLRDNGEEVLQEQYRGHSPGQWNILQQLHDSSSHWDNKKDGTRELSAAGVCYSQIVLKSKPRN